jgi:predicted small secreted protein
MFRRLIAIIALSGSLAVAACNTIEGAGEDVESVGETVQDAAE